jgi:hypothetical protein
MRHALTPLVARHRPETRRIQPQRCCCRWRVLVAAGTCRTTHGRRCPRCEHRGEWASVSYGSVTIVIANVGRTRLLTAH